MNRYIVWGNQSFSGSSCIDLFWASVQKIQISAWVLFFTCWLKNAKIWIITIHPCKGEIGLK